PTLGNGKICYLDIPAADINVSSTFYHKVFGWNVRKREDGNIAFDDGVGEVSGTWTTDRKPSSEVGILIYIMVDNAEETIKKIIANNGKIIQPIGKDFPEITARFSDPAGNIIGIFQEQG
ncbi:MAG: VOC family protein, partial [Ignavibacteriaceae bacterium]